MSTDRGQVGFGLVLPLWAALAAIVVSRHKLVAIVGGLTLGMGVLCLLALVFSVWFLVQVCKLAWIGGRVLGRGVRRAAVEMRGTA